MASSVLVRAAPLNAPIMHPVSVRVHHFFVPNRIMWVDSLVSDPQAGWESFITGGATGTDTTRHPYISFPGNVAQSSLADYLGLPTANMPTNFNGNALPFRAYNMIWNEYYRDQDIQTNAALSLASGADATTSTALQNVCWEKDYLTSARPFENKGPALTLPLQATGGLTLAENVAGTLNPTLIQRSAAGSGTPFNAASPGTAAAGMAYASGIGGDLNMIRQAFAQLRFQEARSRYGSRYVEYLRYLGVRSSDARLMRPEYLGGGRQTIAFSEVLQTGVTTSGTAQTGIGAFGGHGISAMRSNRFRRFFEEHGIVMSLLSIRPRSMYSNPVRRAWLRGQFNVTPGDYVGFAGNRFDYWQKEMQFIGQQQLNGSEVDASAGDVSFGYQDRYDEYRRLESSVHGAFRSSPLDVWHLSREFGSAPSLNASFVSCVPSTRIFQQTTGDNCYVMCNHSIQARRLLAKEPQNRLF